MSKKAIFDKKNVLIIGGAGFIGSHICDELVKTAKVICIDNFLSGDEKNIDHLLSEPDFEFIKHDISKPIDLEKLSELQKFKIEFQGIQEIYNLACPMSVISFKKNKIETLLANSYGLKNSLDLAVKYESKFLFFSSSVVYGHSRENNNKIKENYQGQVDILSPRSAYDEGKRFAESMVLNYKEKYGIDAKIMRLFRTYGPRMMLNDGQMIPDFISNALDNKNLEIFGDENFSSSFCYVSDVVDASTKIMKSDVAGPLNVGSDVLVNLTDLANKIIKKTNSKAGIKYLENKLFLKPLHIPDITKIKNSLSWMPVVTLEKGLEITIYELRATKGLKLIK